MTMLGKHHTKETKAKMSIAKKGKNNPMFGKKNSRIEKQIGIKLISQHWGEIKRAEEIGKKGNGTLFVYHSCVDCGRKRWTPLVNSKPVRLRCRRCGSKGERANRWAGGRHKDAGGYILVWLSSKDFFYPMVQKSTGYVREHRLVIAQSLGRCLEPWEVVHHKNGVKDDNRIENLELLNFKSHLPDTETKAYIKRLEKRVTLLEAEVALLQAGDKLWV